MAAAAIYHGGSGGNGKRIVPRGTEPIAFPLFAPSTLNRKAHRYQRKKRAKTISAECQWRLPSLPSSQLLLFSRSFRNGDVDTKRDGRVAARIDRLFDSGCDSKIDTLAGCFWERIIYVESRRSSWLLCFESDFVTRSPGNSSVPDCLEFYCQSIGDDVYRRYAKFLFRSVSDVTVDESPLRVIRGPYLLQRWRKFGVHSILTT